ncbi:hypothetical protein BJ508DRAFT_411710 [Ascobolus immersus RN42]|uniref:Mitochondrial import inner membrane translocase subunit TIM54 n=1 Tax=Ascobolus immersus RN42 TaxID=1160509 RepID=A0A3N4IJ89_ASCIM|nr:hypothetical protein BJ508DRAFT_411710 [Ascobolus immersus RN42]
MADIKPPTEPPVAPPPPPPNAAEAKPLPKQNPALKAMGLPRMRLPSRNWMIFIGVMSAWAGGIAYDRHHKQKAKDYWIRAVAPLAEVPLPTTVLPRKVTIYLQAPPGDTLFSAKEYFHEYVKPILASAALDYDIVEIRKEGGTWKTVRDAVWRTRRALNQTGSTSGKKAAVVGEVVEEDPVEALRKRTGITREPGVGGELVIGRHVWKEWMHGLQDGWLTPLSEIPPQNLPPAEDETRPMDQEKYVEMALEGAQPEFFAAPVQAIPYPHMLGFLNMPWRIARYFNQRKLADDVGREVAKACFGMARPGLDMDADLILKHEEKDWVSSVWEKSEEVETTKDEVKKEPLKEKLEHLEEKIVEEIHHVEEKALEFVAEGGLGSYSTPGVEAAQEVLDNLKKADEKKLEERKAAEEKEAVEEKKKEEEKKAWVSPKIWQLPMKPDSRILEGLRSFELPLEAERPKEDYAKWW